MKRILCVDDDQDILDIYEIVLVDQGYSVRTTIYPLDIFRLIVEFKPDLILLDINMHRANGLEICREIKSYVANKNTPVIIISCDDSIHKAVCDFGASATISKPFEVANFVETVKYHLSQEINV